MRRKHFRNISPIFILIFIVAGSSYAGDDPPSDIVRWHAHYYERVDSVGLSWKEANRAARARSYRGMRGHLVTITSPEENDVVFALGDLIAYHFGGYQDRFASDYHEPDGGWRWVTDEPWSYSPWSPGEPNDGGNGTEGYLVGWFGNGWNDGQGITERGYVVEYE